MNQRKEMFDVGITERKEMEKVRGANQERRIWYKWSASWKVRGNGNRETEVVKNKRRLSYILLQDGKKKRKRRKKETEKGSKEMKKEGREEGRRSCKWSVTRKDGEIGTRGRGSIVKGRR
jgi:hypothetical protein